jgi:hypothetical protein
MKNVKTFMLTMRVSVLREGEYFYHNRATARGLSQRESDVGRVTDRRGAT